MKYLPLPKFDDVSRALNFATADLEVIGGCELFTTKADGGEKKLYRDIEDALESQHQALLRSAAALTSLDDGNLADQLNLSRSSPFGPLSLPSNRRTYTYLIATLNASHPDYDFSHVLRPFDFRAHSSPFAVKEAVNDDIYRVLPRAINLPLPPIRDDNTRVGGGAQIWGEHMWRVIDEEMVLRKCQAYTYEPEDDPFDGELGAIWNHHYFFYNKKLKRVCYLHLRAQSVLSHTPPPEDYPDSAYSPYSPYPYSPKHKSSTGYNSAIDVVIAPKSLAIDAVVAPKTPVRKKRASGKASFDAGNRKKTKRSNGAEAYKTKAVGSGKGPRVMSRLAKPPLRDSTSEEEEAGELPSREMSLQCVRSDFGRGSVEPPEAFLV